MKERGRKERIRIFVSERIKFEDLTEQRAECHSKINQKRDRMQSFHFRKDSIRKFIKFTLYCKRVLI